MNRQQRCAALLVAHSDFQTLSHLYRSMKAISTGPWKTIPTKVGKAFQLPAPCLPRKQGGRKLKISQIHYIAPNRVSSTLQKAQFIFACCSVMSSHKKSPLRSKLVSKTLSYMSATFYEHICSRLYSTQVTFHIDEKTSKMGGGLQKAQVARTTPF